MNVMDLLRDRAQDIRLENIRQIVETDYINQLIQMKRLNKNDLMMLQETFKFIVRIIALDFEINNLEPNLTSTAKNIIELYQYFGLQFKSELNEKHNQSKWSIFLILVEHLIEITKMVLEFTIKRQTNLKLFCLGKEIGEKITIYNKKIPEFKRVQRSESNHQDYVQQSKQSIQQFEKQQIYDSLPKTQRLIEEIQNNSREISVIRNFHQRKTEIIQNKLLPCMNQMKSHQLSLYRQLKQRNSSIHNSIQTYIKQIYDKNTFVE
ncbi:unnamed protein product [Paramecium sonneborni]|uniref:Uncharacterized protein n=1 Tax=Paramecium sonneborni TaxID=65129 RepID=A0A8S1Q819_9CILI|nr:unnamed protein product [Paramecium sonneborni]